MLDIFTEKAWEVSEKVIYRKSFWNYKFNFFLQFTVTVEIK